MPVQRHRGDEREPSPSDPAAARIARVLRERKSELLDRWAARALADPDIPRAHDLERPELTDHLPLIIDDLVRHLEEYARSPSDPTARGRAGRTFDSAAEHGRQRACAAYSITSAIREISHFRLEVIELCDGAGEPLTADTARIVHVALDEAIGTSVQVMEQLGRAELERARARAEAANDAKDRFLAVISHELRGPLSSILGWIQLVRGDSAPLSSQTARALEVIERSSKAQLRLVEDLLDVERLRAGKLAVAREDLDLRDVARVALESARPSGMERGIDLAADLADTPVMIRGDADRLQQVIANLLTNALKFTPAGGTVRLALEREDGRARLRVSDNGVGMGPDQLAHLFEPFRQEAPAGGRAAGIGLGLALVRTLVEAHDGTVVAESAGPGAGASFTVELPLVEAPK